MASTAKQGSQVDNLAQNMDFSSGVDHMNQVLSFDRLVYFGYIFEESGLLNKNLAMSPSSKKDKP